MQNVDHARNSGTERHRKPPSGTQSPRISPRAFAARSPPPRGRGMSERQFAVSGDWALGADSLQWVLYRRRSRAKGGWEAASFVRSTRELLARCLGEKGCPDDDRARLLDGLPPTFVQWRKTRQSPSQPVRRDLEPT